MENTTSSRKPTKRQVFEELRKVPGLTEAQIAFIDHEIELLDKKNGAERKPTAVQIANDALKAAIYEGMKANHAYTVAEISKEIPALAGMTPQKVSPLMNQMVKDGRLVKTMEKRRSLFSKA